MNKFRYFFFLIVIEHFHTIFMTRQFYIFIHMFCVSRKKPAQLIYDILHIFFSPAPPPLNLPYQHQQLTKRTNHQIRQFQLRYVVILIF